MSKVILEEENTVHFTL